MEQNYKISVNFNENSFEIESSNLEWIEKKEEEYLKKFENRQPSKLRDVNIEPEKKSSVLTSQPFPPGLSMIEFYRKYVQPIKSRPLIGVFFVYYLQRIQKKDEIKTGDIQLCFKEVSYPKWNELNVTDILTNAKRRALVNFVNKLWSLTTTGEDFILNAIAGQV